MTTVSGRLGGEAPDGDPAAAMSGVGRPETTDERAVAVPGVGRRESAEEAADGHPAAAMSGVGRPETTDERAVRRGWTTTLALANLGLWLGYFGPLQVLLPDQVQDIAPHDKSAMLGIVTGFGALVALVAGPVAGALSDATGSRFGRRRPWILGGALLGCLGLAALSGQHSILGVTLLWCVAQAGLNALQAGISALVPDQVPVRQRGVVSGWVGLTQSLGVVVAVVLVSVVVTGRVSGYTTLGILVVLCVLPIVLRSPDPPQPAAERPGFELRALLRAFRISPRRHPDFAWAWGTRFLVQLGNALATLYLLYFLRDKIQYQNRFPGQSASDGLLIVIVLYTVTTLATVVIGGAVSDRSGKRKPSVVVAGYVMAVAALLLAAWPTWTGVLVAAAILGLGNGVYLSVDQALITQVLPAEQDRAKDLGIINIANSAPQVLGPAIAAPVVTYLGGYSALYLLVAVVTIAGTVFVRKIESVD